MAGISSKRSATLSVRIKGVGQKHESLTAHDVAYGAKPATIEEALGDPEIHAVVIATSTDTHANLIQRAAACRQGDLL